MIVEEVEVALIVVIAVLLVPTWAQPPFESSGLSGPASSSPSSIDLLGLLQACSGSLSFAS